MRRRTFDWLMSMGGVVVTVFLVVAGTLMFVGYSYANNSVHKQLADQKIFFPEQGESISSLPAADQPFIAKYAGQQLVNGAQAQAYADHYIKVHLSGVADGKTYAEVSSALFADPENQDLIAAKDTLFRGETLRGLLLNAFAFWKLGQIAKLGSFIAFALAGLMALLSVLGFWHLRRVSPAAELVAPPVEIHRASA